MHLNHNSRIKSQFCDLYKWQDHHINHEVRVVATTQELNYDSVTYMREDHRNNQYARAVVKAKCQGAI